MLGEFLGDARVAGNIEGEEVFRSLVSDNTTDFPISEKVFNLVV